MSVMSWLVFGATAFSASVDRPIFGLFPRNRLSVTGPCGQPDKFQDNEICVYREPCRENQYWFPPNGPGCIRVPSRKVKSGIPNHRRDYAKKSMDWARAAFCVGSRHRIRTGCKNRD